MTDLSLKKIATDAALAKAQDAMNKGDYATAFEQYRKAAISFAEMSAASEEPMRTEWANRATEYAKLAKSIEGKAKKPVKDIDEKDSAKSGKSKEDDTYLSEFVPEGKTDITLDDIVGLDEPKTELKNSVILPLSHPETAAKMKMNVGGGILLYGPPGTGKTMFAKAVANELDYPFYNISCSSILSRYVGDPQKNITRLFETARAHKFAIIFFDEFEALGASRDSDDQTTKKIVPTFLAEMDGFQKKGNLLLIAATNRPWSIDPAFTRFGRFRKLIHVGLPDAKARAFLFKKLLTSVPVDEALDIDETCLWLAEQTEGFTGADINNLFLSAKMFALARNKWKEDTIVTRDDLQKAVNECHSTVSPELAKRFTEFEKKWKNQ